MPENNEIELLKKQLFDLTDRVQALPSLNELGVKNKISRITASEDFSLLTKKEFLEELLALKDLNKKLKQDYETLSTSLDINIKEHYDLSMASRIAGHDLNTVFVGLSDLSGFVDSHKSNLFFGNGFTLKIGLANYAILKMTGQNMAFLASSGDKRFNKEIDLKTGADPILFYYNGDGKTTFKVDNPLGKITLSNLGAFNQVMKNSRIFRVDHLDVRIWGDDNSNYISVTDDGEGILQKYGGEPLPINRFKEISKGFSSNGEKRGFGTALERALVELENSHNYIEVISITKGDKPIQYRTNWSEAKYLSEKPEGMYNTGTKWTICSSKQKL
jgi:hypothetical protein